MIEILFDHIISSGLLLALLFGLGFLFRDVIASYFGKKIEQHTSKAIQQHQHELDSKLAEMQSKLQATAVGVDRALTSVLHVSSERSKIIAHKQLEAAQEIWAAASKVDSLMMPARMAEVINFDDFEKANASDKARYRKFGETVTKNFTPEFVESTKCNWARLFVNEKAWALFTAYTLIIISNTMKIKALEFDFNINSAVDKSALHKAILDALPHQRPTLEKYPEIFGSLFLDEIKKALLVELKLSIQGTVSTEEDIESARRILAAISQS